MMRIITLSIFLAFTLSAYSQKIISLQSGKKVSLRGLSVVNNKVIWASGSNGWIAKSTDGGNSWDWQQIKDHEKLDFRDIEAFSDKKAIAVSAGSPGIVILTEDGGKTWKETYRNNAAEIFLDGMDFSDAKTGFIYGDPIKSKLKLLKTTDGGMTWQNISANIKTDIAEGEASFAASGTAIRCIGKQIWIATGGMQSRIFHSADLGETWMVTDCPVIHGKASAGPFSLAFKKKMGVVVGGDYLNDQSREKNAFISTDGGKTWAAPANNPFGYRSCAEFLNGKIVAACGTSGVDLSYNAGNSWMNLSKDPFHVVRKAKKGNLVIFAGSNGSIGRLEF